MSFTPVAYLKQGCPFSFKFLLSITEMGLLDKIQIEEVIDGEERMEQIRALLSEHLTKASFPSVQVEEGKFMNETNDLIQYFANKYEKDIESLTLVPFYERGLFKKIGNLYRQNKAYQEKYGEI